MLEVDFGKFGGEKQKKKYLERGFSESQLGWLGKPAVKTLNEGQDQLLGIRQGGAFQA